MSELGNQKVFQTFGHKNKSNQAERQPQPSKPSNFGIRKAQEEEEKKESSQKRKKKRKPMAPNSISQTSLSPVSQSQFPPSLKDPQWTDTNNSQQP